MDYKTIIIIAVISLSFAAITVVVALIDGKKRGAFQRDLKNGDMATISNMLEKEIKGKVTYMNGEDVHVLVKTKKIYLRRPSD